jgi:hypothetical protein
MAAVEDDDDYGPAQPIADVIDKYVRKPAAKVLGVVSKVPVGDAKESDAAKAQRAKDVDAANKSFLPTQTAAQKKNTPPSTANGKTVTSKPMPRKRN